MTRDLWVGSVCNHYRGASLEGPQSCFHLQWTTEPVPGNSLFTWIPTLSKNSCSILITYAFKEHSTHLRDLHDVALNEIIYLCFTFPSLTSRYFMSTRQIFLTACFFQGLCKGTLVICSVSPLPYIVRPSHCLKTDNFIFLKCSVATFPDID